MAKTLKYLKGSDIILNLKEVTVHNIDSYSSSSCSGGVSFYIDCQTEHGYCEDPSFEGDFTILNAKKCDEEGVYLLKVKFEKEEDEDWFYDQ